MRKAAVACLLLIVLGACAPRLQPPGTDPGPPRLLAESFRTRDGLSLPVRQWIPTGSTKAIVLALHGFNDYSKAFDKPGAYLAKYGVRVYAYDQRGFGESPHRGLWAGQDVMAADLSDMARLLKARHPGLPFYILGSSMGGAVVMVAVTGADPPPNDGIILAAPAVWGRAAMPWYQRWALAIGAHTVPWMKLSGRRLKKIPSDNIKMLRSLGRDPLVIKLTRIDTIHGLVNLMDGALAAAGQIQDHTLFLYGTKDDIIPSDPSLQAAKALPLADRGQTVALYPKGYHMLLRDLQANTVLDDILAWISNGYGRLPSDAQKRWEKANEMVQSTSPHGEQNERGQPLMGQR